MQGFSNLTLFQPVLLSLRCCDSKEPNGRFHDNSLIVNKKLELTEVIWEVFDNSIY